MSRFIDRIKATLQGTSHDQSRDHESDGPPGHAGEPDQAAPRTAERDRGEHEHKKAHKHC